MHTNEQMGYLAPEIEVSKVMVENGIAASQGGGNVEDPNEGWEM